MKAGVNLSTAVILAAGKGSRLNDRNEEVFSKPMTLVFGKPLISFIIDALITTGIKEIIIVKRVNDYKINTISEFYNNIVINFISDDECSGSLNSFFKARNAVEIPFLLTDCDIICNKNTFSEMIQQALREPKREDSLLGYVAVIDDPISNEKMLEVNGNRAIAFSKRGFSNGVSGGMVYLFLKSPFDIAENVLKRGITSYASFFNELLSMEKIFTMHIDNMWDVDTNEDIEMTEKKLKRE